MKHYLIYGFKASGKTTYARELAEDLGLKHIDLDQEILRIYDKSNISDFYNSLPNEFREIEYKIFKQTLKKIIYQSHSKSLSKDKASDIYNNRNILPVVFSVGGSTLLNKNIDIKELKKHFNFNLIDTDFKIIYKRIQKQKTIYKKYSYKELKEIYSEKMLIFKKWETLWNY